MWLSNRFLALTAVSSLGLLLRAAVSTYPPSGAGTPPLYGDYEAQRHWMEVTAGVPLGAWYVNGTNNDLLYWGLDYPPLSAYTARLFARGAVAVGLPDLVALHASRGHEGAAGRVRPVWGEKPRRERGGERGVRW